MSAPVNHSMPPDAEKAKALAAALAQIEKQFGKGTIMRLGEGEVIEDIQVVSTGSLGLDIAFLALLVIGVIAVVRIRQRTEQNRLELARKYIEKGMNPPAALFPVAAGKGLPPGLALGVPGLGPLGRAGGRKA